MQENSVSSILEHTANDGKKYKTKFYNLDAIIAVGCRILLGDVMVAKDNFKLNRVEFEN